MILGARKTSLTPSGAQIELGNHVQNQIQPSKQDSINTRLMCQKRGVNVRIDEETLR